MVLKLKKLTNNWVLNETVYKVFINLFIVSFSVNSPFAACCNLEK